MSKRSKVVRTVSVKKGFRLPEAKLRFSPRAWYKILYMRESVDTEVSGFGISSKSDPLFVQDFILIKQVSSVASTDMDDESVANYMEDMAEKGYEPAECMRIWIHTHPCNSATPSLTDEDTFVRVFGNCSWSVMFIMAHGGINTAHLMLNSGIRSVFKIPVEVDHKSTVIEEWDEEILENVEEYVAPAPVAVVGKVTKYTPHSYYYGNAYAGNSKKLTEDFKALHGRYDYGYGFDELMDDDEMLLNEELVGETGFKKPEETVAEEDIYEEYDEGEYI